MTDPAEPETEQLEKLLDELIAAPVKRVMDGQLNATQNRLKLLSSDLSDMKEISEMRQQASERLVKDVAAKLDKLTDRMNLLAGTQEQWRNEWREAHAAIARESEERNEAAIISRRLQLYRLTLLAPGAGLLSGQ
jgi:hypothetical protein